MGVLCINQVLDLLLGTMRARRVRSGGNLRRARRLRTASNELVHARAIHRNHNRLAKLKTKGLATATGLDGITSSKAPTDERCPICAETKATRAHISTPEEEVQDSPPVPP